MFGGHYSVCYSIEDLGDDQNKITLGATATTRESSFGNSPFLCGLRISDAFVQHCQFDQPVLDRSDFARIEFKSSCAGYF